MQQIHRVRREPDARIYAMPQDRWDGGTFVEADGTICEVMASGRMPTKDWPIGVTEWLTCRTYGHPVVKP